MRLAILGATGKTGRIILQRAMATGHAGKVLVRNPAKLDEVGAFGVVIGSVDDPVAMQEVTEGVDAVVSAVSSGSGVLEVLAKNLVGVMPANGVSRLVSLIGAGVSMPGDQASLGRSVMLGIMRVLARDNLEDAEVHARRLAASELEWTLVRPPRLTDGPETKNIVHGEHLALGPMHSISRVDLAAFMLELAASNRYQTSAPMVRGA